MTNQTSQWCWNITEEQSEALREAAGKLCNALSMMTNALVRASTELKTFSDAMHATSEETDTPS